MLSHELDASQFVRHARRASFEDPRPERTSRVDRPVPSGYFVASAPPHKSFSCNTYGSPPKYCKQKTYGVAKLFRCNTYKKQGVPIMVNQDSLNFEILTSPQGPRRSWPSESTPAARRKRTTVRKSPSTALHCSQIIFQRSTVDLFHQSRVTRHVSAFSLPPGFVTCLLPPSLTTVNLQLSTAPPARWTSSPLQAIIPFRRHRPGWRLSLRRGNEYFSKRTEPAGIISIRILGYAAVDRRAVRRRDCRAGRVGHCRLFHAVPPEPGSRQAAGSEQDSHRPARPGELAHRRFEEQDGVHHTKSRFDAVRTRAGQEPRRIHPQGAASVRPETHHATHSSPKGKRGKNRRGSHRGWRR